MVVDCVEGGTVGRRASGGATSQVLDGQHCDAQLNAEADGATCPVPSIVVNELKKVLAAERANVEIDVGCSTDGAYCERAGEPGERRPRSHRECTGVVVFGC